MLQEVTLRKSGSAEKLGLTVCYSSGSGSEDVDTEVYISEIVPESLAARDGRLREGDQILRVKSAFHPPPSLFSQTSTITNSIISMYMESIYHLLFFFSFFIQILFQFTMFSVEK